jgi:hypothetical protein
MNFEVGIVRSRGRYHVSPLLRYFNRFFTSRYINGVRWGPDLTHRHPAGQSSPDNNLSAARAPITVLQVCTASIRSFRSTAVGRGGGGLPSSSTSAREHPLSTGGAVPGRWAPITFLSAYSPSVKFFRRTALKGCDRGLPPVPAMAYQTLPIRIFQTMGPLSPALMRLGPCGVPSY